MPRLRILSVFILIYLFQLVSSASPGEILVDDTDPTIIYSSNSSSTWATSSNLNWDPTKLYRGTFHRGDGDARAQYTFAGNGVKVIIAVQDAPGVRTNISFFIDNTKKGEYFRKGTDANQLLYNITAFEVSGLSNSGHVLDIVGGTRRNMSMYIDYIQYTQISSSTSVTSTTPGSTSTAQSDPSASSSAPRRIGMAVIIGIAVTVGVIALLIANLLIWNSRRRRIASKRPKSSDAALLKFHYEASIPRERMSEASHPHLAPSGPRGAHFETSRDSHVRYALPQIPPPSLPRGGS